MFSVRSWVRRQQTPVLGIDVSPASIRVMELVREGKNFRVTHYAQEPLPSGALRDGSFSQMALLTESLRGALKRSGTRLKTAAMALPSGAVIKKILTLPASMYDEEMEMQVETEASQTLPFSLDEISLDFVTVGPSTTHEGFVDVMLVAARKERIDERLALADAAGLRPLVIDIESQAMAASLALLGSAQEAHWNQPIALLQLCSEGSHCYVMLNGLVIYEREMGLPLPRSDQEKSRAATESIREAICQELTRALQLFSTSTQHISVAHIYIAGSIHALGPDLATFVGRRVGIPSSLPDPFAGMPLPSLDRRLHEDAPACLVACGLALRSFSR
ncbi:MAG: pilus assembly protein PilM [Oxalobacteraceae bacterium]|nr:pilus assembly protein PilM [Oxalobacteraceae bacterium]